MSTAKPADSLSQRREDFKKLHTVVSNLIVAQKGIHREKARERERECACVCVCVCVCECVCVCVTATSGRLKSVLWITFIDLPKRSAALGSTDFAPFISWLEKGKVDMGKVEIASFGNQGNGLRAVNRFAECSCQLLMLQACIQHCRNS